MMFEKEARLVADNISCATQVDWLSETNRETAVENIRQGFERQFHRLDCCLSALRILLTWAEFEHGPDYPRGHALVPDHVSEFIRKTLENIGEEKP